MLSRLYKSNLTKREQREVDLIKKDGKAKLIGSVLLYGALFALFSFNFEVKLLNVLSSTSMLDETDELSTIDRIFIKRKADTLFENFGIPFRFLITNSSITLPKLEQDAFYIAIESKSDNAIVHFPQSLLPFQASVDFTLRTCVNSENNNDNPDYASCLENSLELLNNILLENNFKKIEAKGFNFFNP